jgi:tryptophanyl-tRNA synthetase
MSPTAAPRPRVLSGIQPDFGLHLGNYLGALRNWARDQDRYENYFCIVDLHALTQHPDPERLRSLTMELAAMYIACGLDPSRCEIFVQSHVPAHTQLCWILETLTPMGWLDRMTQFKARIQAQGRERINTGVFTYPVLMAADILLYDADFVPVGEDQRQHIELCRDLANRLNSQRGDVFKVPAALISEVGARVMDRPGHAVLLLDSPEVVRRKIARATTDTEPAVHKPLGAGVANLLEIYAALHEMSADVALEAFEGKTYSVLKGAVADSVVDALGPIQARYADLRSDDTGLRRVLADSAARVHVVADATLRRVQEAVGLR